ncbi:MAG: phosphate ABC transporter permease subunit PstC [Eubacteriaceae bacterium]|jgi:phosphate transport system permease protein|nr:phosphate ABC transporter permease subunit PstC [Eubacteriaceae bacterium]
MKTNANFTQKQAGAQPEGQTEGGGALSILSKQKARPQPFADAAMNAAFLFCGLASVVCVAFMTVYMVVSGGAIFAKVGLFQFVLGKAWSPGNSEFGILPMVLSSILATFGAVLVALPVGVLTAVYLSKVAHDRLAMVLRGFIDLLAGIPSVIYGLMGALFIVPSIFRLQAAMGIANSGSLLAAIAILAVMILPTIISVSETSIRAVPKQYEEAALALGSTRLQCIFRVTLPAAKSGIAAGVVLGTGRAIGEAMAVMMVAGNAAVMPGLLRPVRLLTAAIPIEWAYSSGMHRDALYGIGLVLFVFIMAINTLLRLAMKRVGQGNG